ncbi:type 4a pilus biogenesis protein PilO [Arhodomonas sp. SL1]|uniref:type 4a pilus biogenesis protein PilO n=1 Tax=Arhodomonas sp. SL1 TaxID=3425691 RepID=UPI003F885A9F
MNFNLDAYRDLDPQNPGSWPTGAKLAAAVLVTALIAVAGWYFDWQHQIESWENARAEERELREELETKQQRAANLKAYEEQLAEMRESFGAMLRQLPSRAEVSRLLVDISETGLSSGLSFELFRPRESVRKDFYAELPVDIRVRGSYHEFATFVSGVANLPRIVTLHDVSISTGDGGDELVMNLTARTYWYLDDEEAEQ